MVTMRWVCRFGCVIVAGCGFSGNSPDGGTPPSPDARRIDADPDLPDAPPDAMIGPLCPAGYAPILGLVNTSLYRFVNAPTKTWINAETACDDDSTGGDRSTHLAVLDDMTERDALIGGLD